jgi:hypothetical protein
MSRSIYATGFLFLCSLSAGAVRQNSSLVPNLIAPQNGDVLDNGSYYHRESDGVTWKFEWSGVPQATRYHLYVIHPGAKNPVIDKSDITTTSFLQEGHGDYIVDRYCKGWRWKVRAMVAGTWREWSPEGTFDVEPLNMYPKGSESRPERITELSTPAQTSPLTELSAPVQISPPDGMVYSHYPRCTDLIWEDAPGAASYTIEVDYYDSRAWLTDLGKRYMLISNIKATAYSFDFIGAQPGRWRVWAVTADRKEGPKSGWMEFRFTR